MTKLLRFFSIIKNPIKKLWTIRESIKLIYNYLFIAPSFTSKNPKLFYGGSLIGNIGGPLVKVKKLNQFFPEHNWNFNIIYLLSNSIYLSPASINFIRKKRVPIILNQNGVFYPEWFKGNWKEENHKMSKIYHSADYVLWQSNFCKKASEKFLGNRIGNGEILYNAVDTSIFTPINRSKNKFFTFLITGNIRKISNYRIISVLCALKKFISENNNIQLIIAGFIEDRNYINLKIRQLKLEDHIKFYEEYTQKDAPKIYREADAYITMTFQDNCPTAVLEAMASGLPILYSSSGGIPELVGEESGIGIKVKENWDQTMVPNDSAIANGMMEIIDKKNIMSQASRIRAVEFFDIKKWIIRHKNIFEKLLDQ